MSMATRDKLMAQVRYHIAKGEYLLQANAFMSAAIQYDEARRIFLAIPEFMR